MHVACCRTTAAPRGACSLTALAPHHQWRRVPETAVVLAAWLAVPRIADPYRTLSRSCVPALLAAQLACLSPLPSETACRSMAHRHTVRRGKPHPATSDANRFEASRAPAPVFLLHRCGPNPGCGDAMDPYGDHALACPRSGLLARRAKVVERAGVRAAVKPSEPKVRSCRSSGSPDRNRRPSRRPPAPRPRRV